MNRPLSGVRIVELSGLGPAPFACMLLADLGAEVVRIVRPGHAEAEREELLHTLRGRTIIEADLKDERDLEQARELLDSADVMVEGFRPGVLERLGLSPDELLRSNPRLVIARMTGWGQTGPWARRAGHDINYMSLTGALHAIGPADRPRQPLNLVADFGGGAMFLLSGVLAALIERSRTGVGQVLDVAMIDGVSMLMQDVWRLWSRGQWRDRRESNFNDGAAPFYRTYECADGGFVAVGPLEPQFYAQLLKGLGLDPENLPSRDVASNWPYLSGVFANAFGAQPRAHWERVFEGTDACVTPVLALHEVADHPQVRARDAVRRVGEAIESHEAPRFSTSVRRTVADDVRPTTRPADLESAITRWR